MDIQNRRGLRAAASDALAANPGDPRMVVLIYAAVSAAGALLVTEAGGELMMPFEDGEIRFDCPRGVLAANPLCADRALALIQSE